METTGTSRSSTRLWQYPIRITLTTSSHHLQGEDRDLEMRLVYRLITTTNTLRSTRLGPSKHSISKLLDSKLIIKTVGMQKMHGEVEQHRKAWTEAVASRTHTIQLTPYLIKAATTVLSRELLEQVWIIRTKWLPKSTGSQPSSWTKHGSRRYTIWKKSLDRRQASSRRIDLTSMQVSQSTLGKSRLAIRNWKSCRLKFKRAFRKWKSRQALERSMTRNPWSLRTRKLYTRREWVCRQATRSQAS